MQLSDNWRNAVAAERVATLAFYTTFASLLTKRPEQQFAELEQGSAAWHAARKSRLTASNFATAAGLSPYCTANSFWALKTGRVAGELWSGNEHTERGTALEPVALEAYTRLTGTAVTRCGLYVHPRHSWLAASPDGLLGDDGLLEIKCPARQLHDTCPPAYLAQVQGQLAVTGRAYAHFFSYMSATPNSPPRAALFRVERSDEYWAWLLARLGAFWAAVQLDEPPGAELAPPLQGCVPAVVVTCLRTWG